MANNITLGTYNWNLSVDSSQYNLGMRNAESSMNSLSGSMGKFSNFIKTSAIAGFTALGTAMSGAFLVGTKGLMDYDKAMNNFQAQTGYTSDKMGEFRDIVKDIYTNNFGESFDDIAKSMATINQTAALTGDELKKTTEQAILMRDTFGFEVNESINAVNSLMANFGITAADAYNLLAQGAQMGANKNGDLIDTLNEYAPHFAQLGISAEEFTDTLIQGASSGAFSIDKVADAVKEFGIRAKDGSDTSAKGFQSLGLNADEMFKTFAKGGTESEKAFQTVIQKLGDMKDPIAQNSAGVALFGTMFEDLGIEAIKALGDIENYTNLEVDALEQINEVKYDDLGSAFEGIKRNMITGILMPVSEQVLPQLSNFSNWFTLNMPQIKEKVSSAFTVAGQVANVFGDTIKFVTEHSNILIPVLSGVIAGITALQIISTVNGLMIAWRASTIAQTLATGGLNAVLAANPIGLVVTAIGLLVAAGVALYKNWDSVKQGASDLWNNISGFFGNIGSKISDTWNNAKEKTKETWSNITSTIEKNGGGIKGILNAATEGYISLWKGAFNKIDETTGGKLSDTLSKVKEKMSSIRGVIGTYIDGYKSLWQSGFNAIDSITGGKLSDIYNKVKGKMGEIHDTISSMGATIKQKLKDMFDFELPHIKLPHFSIQGSFSLNPPSVPSFDINWYKTGGIFDQASVIGVGEAGQEAVIPIAELSNILDDTMRKLGYGNQNTTSNQPQQVIYQIDKIELPNITNDSGVENLFDNLTRLSTQYKPKPV